MAAASRIGRPEVLADSAADTDAAGKARLAARVTAAADFSHFDDLELDMYNSSFIESDNN
ncbi:hypothetical protein D3C76_1702380 [compost metagenome]